MSVSSDEKNLILKVKRGEIFAFEKLFKKHYRNLCLFAEYYVKEKAMAEEIVNGFFLKFWEKRKSIDIKDSAKSYFYKSIYNQSIKYLEHLKVMKKYEDYARTVLERKDLLSPFSICEWGDNKPWEWGEGTGHLWRTTADIRDCFDCTLNWGGLGVLQILDKQVGLEEYAGPGHWNDPDMLEIGNGGQTISEYRAHFSLWCMLAAPLMAGNDLRDMNDSIRSLLTNEEAIAVNQDSLGMQAFKFIDYGDLEIWVKALSKDGAAFCFLNRSNTPVDLKYNWRQHGLYHFSLKKAGFNLRKNTYQIRDLWKHKNIGTTATELSISLSGHDALMVRLAAVDK